MPPLTQLWESELRNVLSNRRSGTPNRPGVTLAWREINFPVIIKEQFALGGTFYHDLTFSNCTFKQTVSIADIQLAGRIFFQECIFEDQVQLGLFNTTLQDNTFKQNLIINCQQDEVIENLNIDGNLHVSGGASGEIIVRKINVNQPIKNQSLTISTSMNLMMEGVTVKDCTIKRTTEVTKGVTIQDFKCQKLLFAAITLSSPVNILSSDIGQLDIYELKGNRRQFAITDECVVGELSLNVETIDKMSIENSRIDTLNISGINASTNVINAHKVQIASKLSFDRLYNKGDISLREITIPKDGDISILSSNLGKCDFIHCDFSRASLIFDNSKITEVFISHSSFPKIVKLDGKYSPSQARLAFGQLATAFSKQGDTVGSLEYQSREIEAYYNALPLFSKHFLHKTNLWLNKISNNFGRSWGYGIIFSLACGFIFFTLLLISSSEFAFGFPTVRWDLLPAYLKFMNPLRFIETESLFTSMSAPLTFNITSYLWDFLGRIFVAYGYYQTIQAFRRYGRK
jgi:hypothetical protein